MISKQTIQELRKELMELAKEKEVIDNKYKGLVAILSAYGEGVGIGEPARLSDGIDSGENIQRDIKHTTENSGKDEEEFIVEKATIYSKHLSYPQKVLFVIDEINEGVVEDIAKIVIEKDGITDTNEMDRVTTRIRHNSSKLFRHGYLNARRIGKKYLYSKKEESNE